MTEKRVKANEKQKKSVRTVMKELFNVTSASDDDDAIMRSFLGYASNLKNDLENWIFTMRHSLRIRANSLLLPVKS